MALTALGFILRVWRIDAQSLWVDEAFSAAVARLDLVEMFRAARMDTSFPLYYLILKLAPTVDAGELWLRLPSAVLSAATLPVVYLLGRRVAGRGAGVAALVLVCMSPLQIFYAREARCYAALSLGTALATLGLVRALQGAQPSGVWTYAAAAVAVVYLHAVGGFFVFAAALVGIGFAPNPRIRAVLLRANLAVAAAFLLWLPSLVTQPGRGVDWHEPFWRNYPPALVLLRTLEAYSFTPATPAFVGLDYWPSCAAAGGIAWVGLAAWGVGAARTRRRELAAVLSLAALTLLLNYGASFVRPVYLVGRTDVHLFPFSLWLSGRESRARGGHRGPWPLRSSPLSSGSPSRPFRGRSTWRESRQTASRPPSSPSGLTPTTW